MPAARSGQSGRAELVYVALGGAGEIGMNCYLYGYGPPADRAWLMVDLGVTFPGPGEPGVDVIMPDTRFIEDQRDRLAGIVLTHAHEDHVGAVLDLWEDLRAPVYATAFTIGMLRAKLRDYGGTQDIEIIEIKQGQRFEVGPFDLELVTVAHSIPEPNALVMRMAGGVVVHSGDWKLDDEPVIGKPTDVARLEAIGTEGVDVLICDSTNAIREGSSITEGEVGRTLTEIIKGARQAVAVTLFASNMARVLSVAEATRAAGRQLVVAGRSMIRNIEVAIETGVLPRDFKYSEAETFGYLKRDEAVLLCTGSQGEPRAALARIATEAYQSVSLRRGDLVIFSSRTIPGNEDAVGRVQNALAAMGVDIVTDAERRVHVTGHPRREELKRMYAMLKPKALIPMHGEARHMAEHRRLAEEQGIETALVAANGTLVRLLPGPTEVVGTVATGRIFRDGRLIIEGTDQSVRERRKLAEVGIVVVALAVSRKGELLGKPCVITDGVPGEDDDGVEMREVVAVVVARAIGSIPRGRAKDAGTLTEAARRAARSAVSEVWGKKPICKVLLTVV
ncbi:MAG: MBL fold metallo-hydrolase [Rhizobiales bacterium]|nr:MBL fold metallo-hydrolase [Hyphomicrobiales bacterium]